MQSYQEMSREELLREKESLEQQYKEICKKGLKLDMSMCVDFFHSLF